MVRVAAFLLALVALSAASSYEVSIDAWREQREAKLRQPDSWLAVNGLFWLKDGDNRAGSDPAADLALPPERAPRQLGVFRFHGGKTSFEAAPNAPVTLNGKPVTRVETFTPKDRLGVGELTMFLIERGGKTGVRLLDPANERRLGFTGLKWYPVRESYRIVATFTSYVQPQPLNITNVLGQTQPEPSPGYATFEIDGQKLRLDPVIEGNHLFFIFRDQTAAKTTYGAGRFLYTDMPDNGKVVLDFNKAENPPCAFTPYATCPLPPRQNRLAVKIEAGELNYGGH